MTNLAFAIEGGSSIARNVRFVTSPEAGWDDNAIRRVETSPAAMRPAPRQLLYIDGLDVRPAHMPNAAPISASHNPGQKRAIVPELWCYFSREIAVSGNGLLWLGDQVVTEPDLMPGYWRNLLSGHSPESTPETDIRLPIRVIDGPCISALGWGADIYGHVLLEMIPRTLLALRVSTHLHPRVLLKHNSPEWIIGLLEAVGVDRERIEWFDPASERVLLRDGIFPGYPGTHPCIAGLYDAVGASHASERRGFYYLTRRGFKNRRGCANESRLEEIAANEFGAHVIAPEELGWLDQVAIFRGARAVVGLFGSALHTALLSDAGLTVGAIGVLNNMQSAIANIRGQRLAYQLTGFAASQSYDVPEAGFHQMMEAIVTA